MAGQQPHMLYSEGSNPSSATFYQLMRYKTEHWQSGNAADC